MIRSKQLTSIALVLTGLLFAGADAMAQRGSSRGSSRPSASRPSVSVSRPSQSRPSVSRPSSPAPSVSRPSSSRPSYSPSSSSRPSYSPPSVSRPVQSRPSVSVPSAGPSRSPGYGTSGSGSVRYGVPSGGSSSPAPVYRTPSPSLQPSLGIPSSSSGPAYGRPSAVSPLRVPDTGGPSSRRINGALGGSELGSSSGSSSIPIIEPSRPRIAFPRPNTPSATRDEDPRLAGSGPASRRLRTAPATPEERRIASDAARPSHDIGRQSILERYRSARDTRGEAADPSGASARTLDGRRPSGPSQRVLGARARLAAGAEGGSRSDDGRLEHRIAGARERVMDRRLEGARGRVTASPSLRDLYTSNPPKAQGYVERGKVIANATSVVIAAGVGAACGLPPACIPWCGNFYGGWNTPYYAYCWPWTYWYCHFWWGYWPGWHCYPHNFYYGYGWWWPYYYGCYSYYYSPPAYYASVIYQYAEPQQQQQASYADEQQQQPEAVGEGVVAPEGAGGGAARSSADSMALASNHYLTLGDSAFRDGRFGDAVHFYAKAVEFAPTRACSTWCSPTPCSRPATTTTAPTRCGARSSSTPTLLDATIDKHDFYPTDGVRAAARGARELPAGTIRRTTTRAAAGGQLPVRRSRPAAAVDLLSGPEGLGVLEDPAGQLVCEAARTLQYGRQARSEIAEPGRRREPPPFRSGVGFDRRTGQYGIPVAGGRVRARRTRATELPELPRSLVAGEDLDLGAAAEAALVGSPTRASRLCSARRALEQGDDAAAEAGAGQARTEARPPPRSRPRRGSRARAPRPRTGRAARRGSRSSPRRSRARSPASSASRAASVRCDLARSRARARRRSTGSSAASVRPPAPRAGRRAGTSPPAARARSALEGRARTRRRAG